jgi:hypothetical protein
MPQFRKKPVVVEAHQFHSTELPLPFWEQGVCLLTPELGWHIGTLEGPLHISDGDWIIRGVKGEFYPCKPDIFEATYERVEE